MLWKANIDIPFVAEASQLLLTMSIRDHLTEKCYTVKWVDVSMPHKRSRRPKNHKMLEEMARHNPDSRNIFEDNVVDTFYPPRPAALENVCV